MQEPIIIITIRDIADTEAIKTRIREQIDKLRLFYDRINSCHVIVEAPQKHKHQGKLFTVHIDITVPGKELAVTHVLNEDLYVVIRDAFKAARRQLEEYARKQRGDIKIHQPPNRGRITRLFPEERYGFIETADGQEFYFHASNVQEDYGRLKIGHEVEFLENVGGDGLQATHIIIIEE